MHDGSLVDDAAEEVDEEGDDGAGGSVSKDLRWDWGKKTYMTAKTPLGPTCCFSTCTAGQAALLLASKKYVHSSFVPTKAMLTLAASGSRSHSNDIRLDFLRFDQLSGSDWSEFSAPAFGHGEPPV